MDERLAGEVNRLYWESDASVGRIAEQLGISRRALYDALEPLDIGVACPRCGAGLVYPNRSRRESGQAVCPECGLEPDLATLRAATAEAGAAMRRKAEPGDADFAAIEAEGEAESWLEPDPEFEQVWDAGPLAPIATERALRRGRALLLLVAALMGAAMGVLMVLMSRRR